MKKKFLLTISLLLAISLMCLPTTVYANAFQNFKNLFSEYFHMNEEEIYETKKNSSGKELIDEIIQLEESLPEDDDRIAILPHLIALIEKSDEFKNKEIIELIKDEKTKIGLDSALVKMYLNNGGNSSELFSLLYEENITPELKEYVVSITDFSTDELAKIFTSFSNNVSIIAMKRIAIIDNKLAFDLSNNVLVNNGSRISDEKYIAAFLGFTEYYEKNFDDEDVKSEISSTKENFISIMRSLYNTTSNNLLKDQIIYAMARMKDFDLFSYIIMSEDIDFYLKVSAIERNIDLLINKVSTAKSAEELSTVAYAMKLHPIVEVGNELKKLISKKQFIVTKDILELADYIEQNGILGAYKYE